MKLSIKIMGLLLGLTLAVVGCNTPSPSSSADSRAQVVAHRNEAGELVCPVMGGTIASEDKASGYTDVDGKRYYFCCAACKPEFDKNPDKFIGKSSAQATPAADDPIEPVQVGKYLIELWPPEDGVFAGEEIDIEFGVFDSTRTVADGGMAGVEALKVDAKITMPSMQGMPEQKPHIHKEGRAGVHGLEAFFPHGGEYLITLNITPSGEKPLKADFKINVKDERPTTSAKVLPYELEVIDLPRSVKAGQPFDLKLRVVDTKNGSTVKSFETVHEQKFHLLLASKDLSRFLHEHPKMAADGTWIYRATLPAGGDWYVYGDVAPSGKGSRILIQQISVEGPPPSGKSMAVAGLGPSVDRSITGTIEPMETPIPIGKSTTVRVKLTDTKTGQPVTDTQPWLGAAGHLMIIHEDGQTIVHSHPSDDAESAAAVKKGVVTFTGRFPKSGKYIAYSQFQRNGQIHTLGYTLNVP